MHKIEQFLSLHIYVLNVLLGIKYWLVSCESLLVFILLKFKKRPNISRIQFVHERALLSTSIPRKLIKVLLPAEAALQWIERCCTTPITINSCGLSVVF